MLLRETDRVANHSKIIEYLTKLQEIDPLRVGYYRDLASKWSIEHKLAEWISAGNYCDPLNLSGLKLSIICLEQYMTVAEEVDLSQNQIEEKCAGKLAYLKSCRAVNVAGNTLGAAQK
jgi:geranylgeranyl transferase type-2 subunit alpha